jgi:hypothetical protein
MSDLDSGDEEDVIHLYEETALERLINAGAKGGTCGISLVLAMTNLSHSRRVR